MGMAMASSSGNDQPVFMVGLDYGYGNVVYSIRFPDDGDGETSVPSVSVHPVARWSWEDSFSAFAVCGSGSGGATTTVLAIVAGSRDTVVHDAATGACAAGPRLHGSKREPVMLPIGDDTVIVMDTILRRGGAASCCFEALRRLPGGCWRADPLPEPPIEDLDDDDDDFDVFAYHVCISAYFTMGTRVWISVGDRGTFALGLDGGGGGGEWAWRKEGSWELPLLNRAFSVPELGGSVVIGLVDSWDLIKHHGAHGHPGQWCEPVYALELDVVSGQPPAVLRVWPIPAERAKDIPEGETISLAYLGDAAFCLSRSVLVELSKVTSTSFKAEGISFTMLDVSRRRRLPGDIDGGGGGKEEELQLAKRGKARVHVWPLEHCGSAYFIQPAVY